MQANAIILADAGIIIEGKEVIPLRMERIVIQLPTVLKHKLDALRAQGYTAAGYIRSLLERELNQPPLGRKGR